MFSLYGRAECFISRLRVSADCVAVLHSGEEWGWSTAWMPLNVLKKVSIKIAVLKHE